MKLSFFFFFFYYKMKLSMEPAIPTRGLSV